MYASSIAQLMRVVRGPSTRRTSALALVLLALVVPGAATSSEKLTVQLKWYHQFQFAGYYAAQLKGYYRDEGLAVELVEGARDRHPEEAVLDRQAEFGIDDGGELVYQRLTGKPLSAVAAIFQHSPYVLLSKKESHIRHPSDLIGKTVLVTQNRSDAPILAMFRREGVKVRTGADGEPVRFRSHSWNFDDLLNGKADAMSAYLTEIPGISRLLAFEPATLNPLDYGIDFYGDTLFTRSDYLKANPDVVERLRRASVKGWRYAMSNPGEIADYILTLPTTRMTKLDRQALLDEARTLNNIILPALVEIGNMNPGRWEQMARHYLELGMVSSLAPLEGFVYDADVEKRQIQARLRLLAICLAGITLVAVVCLLWARTLRSQVRLRTRELTDEIAERKQAQEASALAASVFLHAREGITITSADGAIIDVNEAFTRITGYSRDEVLGKNPRILKSNHHDADFYAAMWKDVREKGYWHGEIWNRRKNGELYPEILTISAVRDEDGNNHHYVALFSDITPMKEHEQQLEHMAHFDMLTTLPNRVLLADRLHQAMAQAQRRGRRLAVAYLDLDGFKSINDIHGHATGDKLLIALASYMKAVLREGDTLARLGGDEFVAVLLDIEDTASFLPLLNRLLLAASQPVTVGDLSLRVSASLGVTFYPQADEVDADQLLRQADQAMYQAKIAGKGRYHIFDADHDRNVRGNHESREHVRRALTESEFVLHYQPKVNMRSGKVIGAEALIRWQHPERGLLYPAVFLPVIENHPLAIQIGEWVIDSALAQVELWRRQGLHLPVSVNVGARQLQHGDFAQRLREIIARHPAIEPGDLEIEVLETSALEDVAQVSELIEACRELGVAFSLDDFGTGYSSLTYLKRLAVNTIKIDQSFVRDMLDDPDDLAILEGIVSLASAFRRQVIAEGVETVEHGTMLLSLGCELAQGYGIARPMRAEAIPAWVGAWQPDPAWRNVDDPTRGDRENEPAIWTNA
jgi:diguanylate cyclase (GGDEF)-like protein/PAS domain S-box-containing protein